MERKQIPYQLGFIINTVLSFLFLFLPGCSNSKPGSDEINKQIDVFGIHLFSEEMFQKIKEVTAVEEPCIKGYEKIYDQLDVSIGYSKSGYIRKITTLNKDTAMFGIKPGEAFPTGKDMILKAGFIQGDTDYHYKKDWCSFTLLVDKNNIFGMRIEVID